MPESKVLIIEDSRSFSGIVQRAIQDAHSYKVDIAHNFAEAEELLKNSNGSYFVSVVDLNLPDAPNGEAVDLVKAYSIPSIVFTGTSDTSLKEDLWSKGIADYAHKSGVHSIDYIVGMVKRIRNNQDTKVLVVDDSSVSRNTMKKLLILHNYQVVIAKSGEEALEILSNEPDVRLSIIDCFMDGMDGFQLTRKIRETFSADVMEIIGISSQGSQNLSAQFIKSGANDFFVKPFVPEEFLCRVNNCADRLESYANLKELNQVKNRFLGMAAHDIRGPIGAIKTASTYLLTRDPPPERKTALLEMISKVSDDLVELLSNLLDVSAIESGQLELNLAATKLNNLIQERIELYKSGAEAKCITIEFEETSSSPEAEIDSIKMKQVVDNLLTNAIKFTPQEGKISVSCVQDGDIHISIEDSGPGVPEEEVEKLFAEFSTLSTRSTAGEKQTGLGLTIAKKITEAHRGNLEYQASQKLKGSCFTITLPQEFT